MEQSVCELIPSLLHSQGISQLPHKELAPWCWQASVTKTTWSLLPAALLFQGYSYSV